MLGSFRDNARSWFKVSRDHETTQKMLSPRSSPGQPLQWQMGILKLPIEPCAGMDIYGHRIRDNDFVILMEIRRTTTRASGLVVTTEALEP